MGVVKGVGVFMGVVKDVDVSGCPTYAGCSRSAVKLVDSPLHSSRDVA